MKNAKLILPLALAFLLTSCGNVDESSASSAAEESSTSSVSSSSSSEQSGGSASSTSSSEPVDEPPVVEEDQNEIVAIEIASRSSHRVDFALKSKFHSGGLVIETKTRGGEKKETADFIVDSSAYKADAVGTYKINVKLKDNEDISLSYDVNVIDVGDIKNPISLRLAENSTYIDKYVDGEYFAAESLKIEAVYPNGSALEIPSSYLTFKERDGYVTYDPILTLSDKTKSEEKINLTVFSELLAIDKGIEISVTVYNPSALTPTSLSVVSSPDKTHFAYDTSYYGSSNMVGDVKSALDDVDFSAKYKELGDREISIASSTYNWDSDKCIVSWTTNYGGCAIVNAVVSSPSSPGKMSIKSSMLNSDSISACFDFYFVDVSLSPTKLAFINGFTPIKEYYQGELLQSKYYFELGLYYNETDYIELSYDDFTFSCPGYNPFANAGSKFNATIAPNESYDCSLSLNYEINLLPLDVTGIYGVPLSYSYSNMLSFTYGINDPLDGIYVVAADFHDGFGYNKSSDDPSSYESGKYVTGRRYGGIITYSKGINWHSQYLVYDISDQTFSCGYGETKYPTVKFNEGLHVKTELTLSSGSTLSLFAEKGTKMPSSLFMMAGDTNFSVKSDFDLATYTGNDISVIDSIGDYSNIYFAPNGTGDYSSLPFVGEYKSGDRYSFRLYPNGVAAMWGSGERPSLTTYTAEASKDNPDKFVIKMSYYGNFAYIFDSLTGILEPAGEGYYGTFEKIDRTKEAVVTYSYVYNIDEKEFVRLVLPLGEKTPDFLHGDYSSTFTKIIYKNDERPVIKGDTSIEVDTFMEFSCEGSFGNWKDCYTFYLGHLFKTDETGYTELEYEPISYTPSNSDNGYRSVFTFKLKKDGTTCVIENGSKLTIGGKEYQQGDFFGDDFPINNRQRQNYGIQVFDRVTYRLSFNGYYGGNVTITGNFENSGAYYSVFDGYIVYCRENDDGNYAIGLLDEDLSAVEAVYDPSTSVFDIAVNGFDFSFPIPFDFQKYPFGGYYNVRTDDGKNVSISFERDENLSTSKLKITLRDENWKTISETGYSVKQIEKTDNGYKIHYMDGETECVATYKNSTGILSITIEGSAYSIHAGQGTITDDKRFRGNYYSWESVSGDDRIYWQGTYFTIYDSSSSVETKCYISDADEKDGYYYFYFTTDGNTTLNTAKYEIATRTFEVSVGDKNYSFTHALPIDDYEFVSSYYTLGETTNNAYLYISQDYSSFTAEKNGKRIEMEASSVEETESGYKVTFVDCSDSKLTYVVNYDKTLNRSTIVVDGVEYVFQKKCSIRKIYRDFVSVNDDGRRVDIDFDNGIFYVYDGFGEDATLLDSYYVIKETFDFGESWELNAVHDNEVVTIAVDRDGTLNIPNKDGNYSFKTPIYLGQFPFAYPGCFVSMNDDGDDIALEIDSGGQIILWSNNDDVASATFYVVGVSKSGGVYTLDCVKDGHKVAMTYDPNSCQISYSIDDKQYTFQQCASLTSGSSHLGSYYIYTGEGDVSLDVYSWSGIIDLSVKGEEKTLEERFYVYNIIEGENSCTLQYIYNGKKYETTINLNDRKLTFEVGGEKYVFQSSINIFSYPFCASSDDWKAGSTDSSNEISFQSGGSFTIYDKNTSKYTYGYIYGVSKEDDVYTIQYLCEGNTYTATYNEKTRVFETTINEEKYSFARNEINTYLADNSFYKSEDGKTEMHFDISYWSDESSYTMYIELRNDGSDYYRTHISCDKQTPTIDNEKGTATFTLTDYDDNEYTVIYDYVNNQFTIVDANGVSTTYIAMNY